MELKSIFLSEELFHSGEAVFDPLAPKVWQNAVQY